MSFQGFAQVIGEACRAADVLQRAALGTDVLGQFGEEVVGELAPNVPCEGILSLSFEGLGKAADCARGHPRAPHCGSDRLGGLCLGGHADEVCDETVLALEEALGESKGGGEVFLRASGVALGLGESRPQEEEAKQGPRFGKFFEGGGGPDSLGSTPSRQGDRLFEQREGLLVLLDERLGPLAGGGRERPFLEVLQFLDGQAALEGIGRLDHGEVAVLGVRNRRGVEGEFLGDERSERVHRGHRLGLGSAAATDDADGG